METTRYVYPVDITELEKKLEFICGRMGVSKAEAIRGALESYYEQVKGIKVIETRQISDARLEKEVLEYLKKRKTGFTSEIADDLRADVVQVNRVLNKLAEKGTVR